MSLYTVYMYPESPVGNEDMYTRTLLCAYMYMPCCLTTELSTSLDEATCMMVTGFKKCTAIQGFDSGPVTARNITRKSVLSNFARHVLSKS